MFEKKVVVGVVTARGGSKGIPGKNIRPLRGKPLIAHTIEAALAAGTLDRVLVSTDDDEIAKVSRRWGADVPFRRPAELASDSASHLDTLLHVADWLEEEDGRRADYLVNLQPTSPLRESADIDGAVEMALRRDADAVVGVCLASAHPYLVKRIEGDGALRDFVSTDLKYLRRQDFPPAYVLNGAVYVNRVSSLRRDRTMFPETTLGYVMPESRSHDIDTLQDWAFCELLLSERPRLPRAA